MNSDFQNSDHLAAFLNSALSYAFLNKFGGTATSFDIFLRRPLGPSGQFISRCENEDLVEQFPMTAEAGGILTQDLVEQLRHAYDAANPDSTGSKLITRRLSRLCKVKYIQELEYKCGMDNKKRTRVMMCLFVQGLQVVARQAPPASRLLPGGGGEALDDLRPGEEQAGAAEDRGGR